MLLVPQSIWHQRGAPRPTVSATSQDKDTTKDGIVGRTGEDGEIPGVLLRLEAKEREQRAPDAADDGV